MNAHAALTGLEYRPVADGQRVSGIYRLTVMLARGRYAMLDYDMGFSLVPWMPMIEQQLGLAVKSTGRLDGSAGLPSLDRPPPAWRNKPIDGRFFMADTHRFESKLGADNLDQPQRTNTWRPGNRRA